MDQLELFVKQEFMYGMNEDEGPVSDTFVDGEDQQS